MRDRQTGIDCGKQSPETETNYTLISSQFGWRLTRRRLDNGEFVIEWRCPDCWRAHKKKQDEPPSSTHSAVAERAPQAAAKTRTSRPPPRRASSKPPAPGADPLAAQRAARDGRKRPPG